MKINRVTFTGVDDNTNIEQLVSISKAHPIVEWGILYSQTAQGYKSRYPSVMGPVIKAAMGTGVFDGCKLALHVCGSSVWNLLAKHTFETGLLNGLAQGNELRVQLNLSRHMDATEYTALESLISTYDNVQFIRQVRDGDAGTFGAAILFDGSAGTGKVPDAWPEYPNTMQYVGYAGGLGPDNLATELDRIAEVVGSNSIWIDMESNVRTDDLFDLDKCLRCLELVESSEYV